MGRGIGNISPANVEYVQQGRDLRLDFLRGLVMLVVICVHLEYPSYLSMFMWERLGMVSSAEGFVLFSGVVLGIVYKKRLHKHGLLDSALKLWRRAGQLYIVNVAVICSVLLLSHLPGLNVLPLTTWGSPAGGPIIQLFPTFDTPWGEILKQTLLLEIGPHQFRVMGLYALLIACAPIVLYLLHKHYLWQLLTVSWLVYALNIWLKLRISHAGFEYAFPVLSWQLLFFNGMIIGYYHEQVFHWLADQRNAPYIYLTTLGTGIFMLFALANPRPLFWPWSAWQWIDQATYRQIYMTWFYKKNLCIGRVVNNALVYASLFAGISWYWKFCYRWLGWLFIPIGQASLYVFIWHIYVVLLWSNLPLTYTNLWLNTLVHVASIGLIWLMVQNKFMFGVVPR